LIGALVGGVFSGSAKGETAAVGKLAGMGMGAVIGAGVCTMVSAATPGPSVTIPAESQMDFYLASPISVVPIQRQRASATRAGISSRRPGTLCARRYPVGSACSLAGHVADGGAAELRLYEMGGNQSRPFACS
jgi:hypothetical protein